ncbi:MAG: Hsp70 family protein, partial [Candidatus Hodarchaeota archaeon]
QKKIKEAEKFANQDKKIKEEIEIKNQADSMVYNTEKLLNEHKDKIPDHLQKKIEKGIGELKETIKTDDARKIKSKMDELEKYLHEMSTIIYQAAAQQQAAQQAYQQTGQPTGTQTPPKTEKTEEEADVVDADYVIEDEDEEKK